MVMPPQDPTLGVVGGCKPLGRVDGYELLDFPLPLVESISKGCQVANLNNSA